MTVMLPVLRLYRLPGSAASTVAMTLVRAPARTQSRTVTNRSGSAPALCTTVPAGMWMSYPAGVDRRKLTTPVALAPGLRASPRMAAWRSSHSPVAVPGKAWREASSARWQHSSSWAASTCIRIITSDALSGVHLVWFL